MRRHLKILDFALASLRRRRLKNWAIIAVYAFTVAIIASVLLEDTGLSTEAGAVAMLSAVVLGIAIGMRLEHLGRGAHKWRDWSVVIVGTVLGLIAVSAVVLFLALFGTLLGLYAAAMALGAWLVLRLAIAATCGGPPRADCGRGLQACCCRRSGSLRRSRRQPRG